MQLEKAASANIRKLGIDDHIVYGGYHIRNIFLEKGIGNRASQVTYLNRKDSSFGQKVSCLIMIFSCLDGQDALHICGISLAMNENVREVAFAFCEGSKKKRFKSYF